jgi:hypothetical protein
VIATRVGVVSKKDLIIVDRTMTNMERKDESTLLTNSIPFVASIKLWRAYIKQDGHRIPLFKEFVAATNERKKEWDEINEKNNFFAEVVKTGSLTGESQETSGINTLLSIDWEKADLQEEQLQSEGTLVYLVKLPLSVPTDKKNWLALMETLLARSAFGGGAAGGQFILEHAATGYIIWFSYEFDADRRRVMGANNADQSLEYLLDEDVKKSATESFTELTKVLKEKGL